MRYSTYYDGLSARVHNVFPVLEPGLLRLRDHEGRTLALWIVEEIIRRKSGERGVWLLVHEGGEGRLFLRDTRTQARLREINPRLGLNFDAARAARISGLSLALLALGGLILWQGLPVLAAQLTAAVPPGLERRMGERIRGDLLGQVASSLPAPDILTCSREERIAGECPARRDLPKSAALCAEPEGSAALRRLADHVARDVDLPWPLSVEVVNMKISNAGAIPGGYIVLFRGLIEEAESPDMIAGVLAHEIGHVAARHGLQGLIRNTSAWFLLGLITGDLTGALAIAGVALVGAAYSREMEREADAYAVDLMRRRKIDPEPLAAWMEKLGQDGPPGLFSLFLTHPRSPERAAVLREIQVENPRPVLSDSDFAALKKICGEKQEKPEQE